MPPWGTATFKPASCGPSWVMESTKRKGCIRKRLREKPCVSCRVVLLLACGNGAFGSGHKVRTHRGFPLVIHRACGLDKASRSAAVSAVTVTPMSAADLSTGLSASTSPLRAWAMLLARIHGGLAHDRLISRCPGVPGLLVDHKDQRVGHITPGGDKFLAHGVHLQRMNRNNGFPDRPRHRWTGPVGRQPSSSAWGWRPWHLNMSEKMGEPTTRIFMPLRSAGDLIGFGVRQFAVTVFAPGQRHHARLVQRLEDFLPTSPGSARQRRRSRASGTAVKTG